MFTYLLNAGDVDIANHLARLDAAETVTVKSAVSSLILGLKMDGIWNDIAILCVAHNVEADSLLNIKGNTTGAPDSSAINSPVFVASKGFTIDSANVRYITMGVNEGNCSLYALGDSHFVEYMRTFVEATNSYIAGIGNTSSYQTAIQIFNGSPDTVIFSVQGNNAGAGRVNISQNVPIGFIGMTVQSNGTRYARLNDTIGSSAPTTHILDVTDDMLIGSQTGVAQLCDEQIAAWGTGAGMTPTKLGLYENRIRTYMQAIGADVY